MKSHLLPLTTATLLAVRLTGLAAVPYAVVFTPLAVMVLLALIALAITIVNRRTVNKALEQMAAQLTQKQPPASDDTPYPGLYL